MNVKCKMFLSCKIAKKGGNFFFGEKRKLNMKNVNNEKMLCSPCVPNIFRLVHIPCQCSCTLFSAPLLMRAWHSLHITIKAQTQKHIVNWKHLLRAFPFVVAERGCSVEQQDRSGNPGEGNQRVTLG